MRSRRVVGVLVAIALLATAACSSDKKSGSSGGSTNSTLKGDPILVGTIGSYSGPQASSIGLSDDGMQVWADAVNAGGGINGHPVKLFIKDDANDPAKALQGAKELVEQDHVVAILGDNSQQDAAFAKYVQGKGVPVIGGNPTSAPFSSNPDFYPTGTNVVALIFGQFVRMKDAGLSKMGLLYCAEVATCAQLTPLAKAVSGLVPGTSVAAAKSVSATQPSYAAECLAMKKSGVDSLFVADAAAIVVNIVKGCKTVGYDPKDVNQATIVSSEWLKTPEFEGALLTDPNIPNTDDAVPGVKEFLDAVKKYKSSMLTSPQFTPNVLWSWLSGKLFEKAAAAGNIGPTSTSAEVKTALYTIKDETLGGAAPPLTFVKDKATVLNCWFNVDLTGGKLKTVDVAPVCPTAEQLAGLTAILGG